MKKGDIVLIVFPFADLSGSKLRPALVLAETSHELTVVFITTQMKWVNLTDVILGPDKSNGIKKQSLIRISKIATLDKTLVKGRLGYIDRVLLKDIDAKVKTYLQLI